MVSQPRNVTYLTGFAGTAGLLLVGPAETTLILDSRYALGARQARAAGALADVPVDEVEKRYDLTLMAALGRMSAAKVGIEAAHLTVLNFQAWQRAYPAAEWLPVSDAVESQRLIKDAWEQATFRRGGRLIADVAGRLREFVRAGRTEVDVAADIDQAVKRAGFSAAAFPTIVASGPNSALPHVRPTPRVLQEGDLVVLDFGGVLDGYCLDLTRVAAVGPPSNAARALFDAVLAANRAAREAVKPGVDVSVIDRAAREVLEVRGLGAAFLHATGHGLGLDVHEAPRIARPDLDPLMTVQAGMVFTVEPGAYLSDVGGVRLEDDVLVTAEGCEVLTDAPRELVVV